MGVEDELRKGSETAQAPIELPAPTAWPMALALGVGLGIAGMVTSPWVTAAGVTLALVSAHGWFREVLPVERHEAIPVSQEVVQITRSKRQVAKIPRSSSHRQVQPMHTFSLLPGLEGGIAGGAAMIVPAVLYGLLKYHSPWYAVNLLAAGGFPSWADQSAAFFSQFHWKGLIAAVIIHGVTCPLVGLLYAAILPMFPKRPIITAGIIVPLFWTSMLYGVLGLVSPILNQRIDWAWFIPSQLAFGLVTGYVVNRSIGVRSEAFRNLSFAERAGLSSDTTVRERDDNDENGGSA